ncbi:hypothetical protein SacmaDRAFT_2863 [Saccharomonospora marina XMU15]|uniref:Uncharacterized protein n=1 Tax=Saccharomonospora marina XMU15 TaxID=882083 RepID=H5X4M5_9PSEU|nr:hypothetical protein SacmaDRAFT_2863 [Saccharomonospora marina XMU15]
MLTLCNDTLGPLNSQQTMSLPTSGRASPRAERLSQSRETCDAFA